MIYTVYILLSKKDHKLYVGCTTNIDNRLKLHNSGNVPSTKNRKPFVVIYQEKFKTKTEAFNRERFLKSLWSGRFKRELVREYLNKNNHWG